MKSLTSKGLTQKIIIAIVILILFNFVVPIYSSATDLDVPDQDQQIYENTDNKGKETDGSFGGVLLGPVIDLFVGLFDSILAGLQFFMYDGTLGGGDGITEGFLVSASDWSTISSKYPDMSYNASTGTNVVEIDAEKLDKGWINGMFSWVGFNGVNADNYGIPVIQYTPEKIFSNKVPALQVNFISPPEYTDKDMNKKNIAEQIQPTIASWYVGLKNLATVGLLSVLMYIGIRIIISSTGSDKAKYKKMLMDWLVALCILFFLHYIMAFMLEVTETIIDGIEINNQIPVSTTGTGGGVNFNTDLTGLCRFQVQYASLGTRTIYLVMYMALVICTCMFTWTYVKRVVTMAFLTLMAPMVALTYPIDKIRDGKAQAFNSWFKEYLFNLLIQPFHLLIYSAFLGSSMNIATVNPIFAIMFLAFLIPAEKLLRKFFGIGGETAGGLGAAAGLLGGAAVFKKLSGAVNKGAKGGGGGSASKGVRTKENNQLESSNSPRGLGAFATGTSSENMQEGIGRQQVSQNFETVENTPGANTGLETTSNATFNPQQLGESNLGDGFEENRGFGEYMRDNFHEFGNNVKDKINDIPLVQKAKDSKKAFSNSIKNNKYVRKLGNNKAIRTMANSAGRIGRGVGNVATKAIKRTVKAAPRMAMRAGMTAAGAALGVGMGIASGDMDNVLSMGAAGAALGGTAGADAVMNTASRATNALKNTYREGAYGEEGAILREQARNFSKDEAKINYVRQHYRNEDGSKLSRSQLNQVMVRAAELNNNGVTDMKDIVKGLKLEDEINTELRGKGVNDSTVRERMAREQSTTIMKQVKGKDADYFRDEKKMTSLNNSYVRELQSRGLNKEQAQLQANDIINKMKKQRGVY